MIMYIMDFEIVNIILDMFPFIWFNILGMLRYIDDNIVKICFFFRTLYFIFL